MRLKHEEYQHFRWAILFSLLLASVVGIFVAIYGKDRSFLVINGLHSSRADYFFTYVTYLGDGLIWIPFFLYVLIYKRDFFIAILSALIICTLITHGFKRIVFVDEPRPLRLLHDLARAVPLVKKNNYVNSFPSGHTSTAFTFALLMAFIVRRKFAVYVFPLLAFIVGYSRVYLAQHFVTDVLAGMVTGVISSYLALLIYEYFRKKKRQLQQEASP